MFPYDTTTQANLKVFLFLFTIHQAALNPSSIYLSIHHKEILTAILHQAELLLLLLLPCITTTIS
jgi:hypothetical protein